MDNQYFLFQVLLNWLCIPIQRYRTILSIFWKNSVYFSTDSYLGWEIILEFYLSILSESNSRMDTSSKSLIISEDNEDISSCVCLLSPDHWKRAISSTCWDLTQNKNTIRNKCPSFHTQIFEIILKIFFYIIILLMAKT